MEINEIIIGISMFVFATIFTKLIEIFFNKKAHIEEEISINLKTELDKVINQLENLNSTIHTISSQFMVSNERMDALSKLTYENTARINKIFEIIIKSKQ